MLIFAAVTGLAALVRITTLLVELNADNAELNVQHTLPLLTCRLHLPLHPRRRPRPMPELNLETKLAR